MTAMTRRRPGLVQFGDVFDLLESGFPFSWRVSGAMQSLRVEDFVEKDRYVVRAELPGIDPEKDVEVSVGDGMLTITAERREEKRDKQRSEFHYGSFTRSVALPAGAREDQVSATYNNGVLQVSVGLAAEVESQTRKIPVQRG